ncbi:helix-turn-helix domain-containing protein [Aquimarina sp. MMG016]|uniref:AraC family transcriptional regulator n=1 Tax=Aquimarina sp. MMG016 TaxID=2822690 RepID=UPI001B39DF50|nr:helix-turn-helix domain-containing protein [Aquimarina sp. MMG016]MBQ4818981.1 AraC family transcriptional regulator [Aquimarina sp. MMG016]
MQSILNQLVYFGYFQSLFLLFIYVLSPKKRKSINGYVAFLVLVLAIGLTGRVLYISGYFGDNYRWVIFSEFATLLFGATIYLFTRSSLLNKPFSYRELFHYLPAVVYNIFVTVAFILPSDEILKARTESGENFRFTLFFITIGLIFNITYWALSLKIFLKFKKDLKNELSYHIKSQFFMNFLIAVGFCLICWFTLFVYWVLGYVGLSKLSWQVIWISIALIILFITFYGMKEPKLFSITTIITPKKYAQSKLSNTELEALKLQLEHLMEEKKPYLNRKLLKSELAEMLGVSNPEIARLLNERIGMNFFEYINYYRIKEFIELAKTDKAKSMTFFGLAQEAGFNSKTTFNKSFKDLMGSTPKVYFTNSSIKNEQTIHKP